MTEYDLRRYTVTKDLTEKKQHLAAILKKMGKICIAYSGGVDSAFLLKAAVDTLSQENVLAVTAISRTFAAVEKEQAKNLALEMSAHHVLLDLVPIEDTEFWDNTEKRCYFCKKR